MPGTRLVMAVLTAFNEPGSFSLAVPTILAPVDARPADLSERLLKRDTTC